MDKRCKLIGVERARAMFPVVPVSAEFLRPHPATLAWWAARDACRTCRHHLMPVDSGGERCGRLYARVGSGGVGRCVNAYCIDARGEGARCGPGAALHEPGAAGGRRGAARVSPQDLAADPVGALS